MIIGVDAGGSHTRAIVVALDGRIVGAAHAGPGSPKKSADARAHVRRAIADALSASGLPPHAVTMLVAGVAGLDDAADLPWAETLTAENDLTCLRVHVNDAVVAHAGALAGEAGVIVIGGTGAIIYGVTETGRTLRNYDLHHYAATAARQLAFDCTYRLLAGDGGQADAALCATMLSAWGVSDLDGLRELAALGFVADDFELMRRFSALGPVVTAAALAGSPVAVAVCRSAAHAVNIGVRLLGGYFAAPMVRVALLGSAARSPAMRAAIGQALSPYPRYSIVEPAHSAEYGAALLGLRQLHAS